MSVKAGAPRAWQAGLAVTPNSTVSLRYGNVFTVLPITGYSGLGPPIHMALYHNSKSPVSGLSVAPASGVNLGGGWTHSFGGQLNLVSSTEIWVIADDGTIDKFTKPSSTWVPPAGVHDALTTISGGYRVTHKDQTYREYDSTGRLTIIGHPDGNQVRVAYATVAGYSRISYITDAASRVLTFGYNTTSGELTSITAPLTSSTTRQWTLGYNSGQLETVTDPLSHTVTVAVDGNSKITSVTDANGNGATIDYDRGTGVLVTDPAPFDDQTVNIEYDTGNDTDDSMSHVETVTDPCGKTTTTAYDHVYHRASVTDPVSSIVAYTYDGVGNLLTQTAYNESGSSDDQVTTYTYDAANRRTVEDYPDNTSGTYTRTFQYNKVGNVTSRTDQIQDVTSYSYDDLHRLTGRSYTKYSTSPTYPASQGPDAFAYDRTGRMIGADREYGSADLEIDLTYDKAGRVTSLAEAGYTIGYDYDVSSTTNYREITYTTGRVIREDMDGRDRVTEITDVTGSPISLAENEYDDTNRLTFRQFGNDTGMEREYDDAGRVTQIDHFTTDFVHSTIAKVAYGRDAAGNPIWREDLQTLTHSETYAYDNASRLTSFDRGTLNTSTHTITTYTSDANLTQHNGWTLDKLGNWDSLVKQVNGVSVTEPRTNNEANEYLTMDPDGSGGASPISLVHDDNGNLKDDGTYLYDYDIENRMTRVRLKAGPVLLAEYHYDALGRRIRKIIPSGQPNAGTWTYAINEQWQVLSEYQLPTGEEESIVVRDYCHGGKSAYVDDHVAMFTIHDDEEYYEDWYFYHTDAQFCTLAMTDGGGGVAERYVTDPYGKAITYNASWGSPQSTSCLGNPFMHQGLWLDGECQKLNNRHREYSSMLGRFLIRDPEGYVDGPDLFEDESSNPLIYLDPLGLDHPGCDIIGWPGGVVGVIGNCELSCCASHDRCYQQYGCTANSWLWPSPPICGVCNAIAASCFAGCNSGNPPMGPLYYCACCNVSFDDPKSPHMKHSTGSPTCQPIGPVRYHPTTGSRADCVAEAQRTMTACGGPSVQACYNAYLADVGHCVKVWPSPNPMVPHGEPNLPTGGQPHEFEPPINPRDKQPSIPKAMQ